MAPLTHSWMWSWHHNTDYLSGRDCHHASRVVEYLTIMALESGWQECRLKSRWQCSLKSGWQSVAWRVDDMMTWASRLKPQIIGTHLLLLGNALLASKTWKKHYSCIALVVNHYFIIGARPSRLTFNPCTQKPFCPFFCPQNAQALLSFLILHCGPWNLLSILDQVLC